MGVENQLAPPQEQSEENALPNLGQTAPAKRPRRWLQIGLGTLLTLPVIVAIALVWFVETPRQKRLREINELTAQVNAADNGYSANHLYRELFEALSREELEFLKQSEEASIAVQAAWQLVKPTEPRIRPMRPTADRLAEFLDFFEAHGPSPIPAWWREVILEGQPKKDGYFRPGRPSKRPYHDSGLQYVKSPNEIDLRADTGAITLTLSDDTIGLPPVLATYGDHGLVSYYGNETPDSVSGTFTEEHFILVLHESFGYEPLVAKVERKTGRILWTASACGCYWPIIGGGISSDGWVSVVAQNEHVIVYGKTFLGVYAHAFHEDDGRTLFRFSSSF